MLKRFLKSFRTLYYADVKSLPPTLRKAFFEEITNINHRHAKPVLLVLLIAMILLLILDFTMIKRLPLQKSFSDNMLYLHIFGFCFALIYNIVFQFIFSKLKITAQRLWLLSFVIISLLFCELISANTLVLSGQIIAILIFSIVMACMYILNAVNRTLLFAAVYLSFNLVFKPLSEHSVQNFGIWVETTIILVISLLASKYVFDSYLEQFMNRKIILKNIKEIGRLNYDLETKVHERTEALTRAKEQIELEKLRISFFTNLYHEFRTPVNVILSAEQLLEMKLKKMVSPKEFKGLEYSLHSIQQYSYRLIRLSSNLIDITRIDNVEYVPILKNVDIVHLIENIVTAVQGYIKSHQIALKISDKMQSRVISIDAEKIERAFLNLLSNAVKFTPKGGEILVSLYEDNNFSIISVRDSGIGIPENMKDKIFNRFVQVDRSLTRDSEGSGLGLAIVKAIVEMHKGNIEVKSALYNGSEFIISLPICTVAEDETMRVYAFEGRDCLDLLKIEFSDIET